MSEPTEPSASPAPTRRRERAPQPDPRSPRPSGAGRRASAKPPPRRVRRARKVHRVVRHVELWSVFKIAVLGFAALYLAGLIAGFLMWQAADQAGTIDGIEGFFADNGGYEEGTFEIRGDVVLTTGIVGGAVAAGLGVALSVLGALLFNLFSELTGGVRMTVIDEDLVVTKVRRSATGPPRPEAVPEVAERGGPRPRPADDVA